MTTIKRFSPNKTTEYYNNLNTILYILGLPDFWIEVVKLPKTFVKKYNVVVQILNVVQASLVAMIFLALFTQNNLLKEQRFSVEVKAFIVPAVYFYYLILIYRRTEIRELLYQMGVLLKEVHNDKQVEKQMIKNLKLFINLYFWSWAILQLRTGVSLIKSLKSGETPVVEITAWPDITDKSTTADVIRCIVYIIGLLVNLRKVGSHIIIFMIFIGLNYQFKNIQSYFNSINKIFAQLYLSQEEKEDKFEKAFKAGIKMHETTLWCTKQCQILFGIIFNNQVIMVTIIVIPLLSDSMKPENSPIQKILLCIISIIFSSFIWFCAGNIKIEALKVSDAMYGSGWHNCFGKSSVRVRKLVVIAMTRAQKPVFLTAFNIIEISYEVFWNLIKSAFTTPLVLLY